MNKKLKIALGLIISISLIFYLFYKIDIRGVKNALWEFDFRVLLVLLLIYIAGMILRSLRWQLLIRQREKVDNILVFKALVFGYMINNLLPAKVGELARAEYLKRKKGISRSFILGTIFIERLSDLSIVMILFAFSLLFSKTSQAVFIHNQWIIYFLAMVMVLSVYFMFRPRFINRLIGFLPPTVKPRIEQIIISFTESIQFVNDKRLLSGVSFLTVLIWGLTLSSAYSILWGLGVILPIHAYFFLITAGVFGMVIPSTSGGIGVYHAISTAALLLFNVPPEKALAFALISHAFDFFPSILMGVILFLKEIPSFVAIKAEK
jgi:glycosyltransferase 2 family protein